MSDKHNTSDEHSQDKSDKVLVSELYSVLVKGGPLPNSKDLSLIFERCLKDGFDENLIDLYVNIPSSGYGDQAEENWGSIYAQTKIQFTEPQGTKKIDDILKKIKSDYVFTNFDKDNTYT